MKTGQRVWLPAVRQKIIAKHGVQPDEVEEVFRDHMSGLYAKGIAEVRMCILRWAELPVDAC